jgi:hypothetical protein
MISRLVLGDVVCMTQYRADVFTAEPMAAYQARRGDYLTSHQLIDYCQNPALYRKTLAGLVPRE